jgi:hypothetical protein
MSATDISQTISALATVVAAGLLWWYTKETQRLRKTAEGQLNESIKTVAESQKQTENALMPVLNLTVDQAMPGAPMTAFFFHNVGNGPAFNISPKVDVPGTDLSFAIAAHTSLLRGERKPIEIRMGSEALMKRLKPESDILVVLSKTKAPIRIDATYRAVTGKKYFTGHSIELGDSSFFIQFVEHKTIDA